MDNIRTYIPKETITLYDRSRDKQIKGVIYFKKAISDEGKLIKQTASEIKESSQRWLDDRYPKVTQFDLLKFKTIAIVCFMLALVGFISLVLPIAAAEAKLRLSYFESNTGLKLTSISNPIPSTTPFNNAALYYSKDEIKEPQNFSVTIPKIDLESIVIPDVDPSQDTIYNIQLKNGVAQARGSYLPGQKGTIFLFAHSTDTPENILQYNAKFYAVKDLQPGDEIVINYHGKQFSYTIYDKKITSPFDLETIRSSKADLILQTCWPPGTDWKRIMVFAKQT